MPETTSRLRCVTLNVLGPANPDWERRSLIIKEVLDRLGADVVALQEVRAADAEHLLGSGYQVTPFSETSEDGTGGVLATRAPHDVLDEIDQRTAEHGHDLPWCATLVVTLDSPVGRLVVAHHKPNWPFPLEVEREQQARRAALAVERHAGDGPAVVLGDFDATPDAGVCPSGVVGAPWTGSASVSRTPGKRRLITRHRTSTPAGPLYRRDGPDRRRSQPAANAGSVRRWFRGSSVRGWMGAGAGQRRRGGGAPLSSPRLAGFLDLLDPLDELARRSPGFVWRPQPNEVAERDLVLFGDPSWVVVNLSVWASLADLRDYLYGPQHAAALRRRRQWFRRPDRPGTALWWTPAGERPTFAEAHRRLELLRRAGPSAEAFDLRAAQP